MAMKLSCENIMGGEGESLNPITTCKFSPESEYLAVGKKNGCLEVYQVGLGKKPSRVTQVTATSLRSGLIRDIMIGPRRGRSNLQSGACNGFREHIIITNY